MAAAAWVATHHLAGIDPGEPADSEVVAQPVGSIDEVCPARCRALDVWLEMRRDAEDELRRDRGSRRFGMFGGVWILAGSGIASAVTPFSRV
jgi:hypothetical protein